MNFMHRCLFAKAYLCKLGAARGERWGGGVGGRKCPLSSRDGGSTVKMFPEVAQVSPPAGYLLARKISYWGNQTRWVATNRIKEKGGPADTGLVHWACCSRRYRVTIKSNVGGDGGRVSRGLFGKRRWKKFKSSIEIKPICITSIKQVSWVKVNLVIPHN